MNRRIVQAFFAPPSQSNFEQPHGAIFALCDDGSMWKRFADGKSIWTKEAEIPEGFDATYAAVPTVTFTHEETDSTIPAYEPPFETKQTQAAEVVAKASLKKAANGKTRSHHA